MWSHRVAWACSEQAVVLQQCCIPGWRHVRLFPAICPTKNWNLTRFLTTYWEITSFCRFQKKSWWPGHFEKGLAKLNSFSSMPGIKGSLLHFWFSTLHFTTNGLLGHIHWWRAKFWSVVVKRRQKGRDPGVIPLRSHPRSTLFSAQPSLTSTAKWPNYQPPALYPFKCPAPQSLHLQLWFQALLKMKSALPGPWCSCLHATWCTRRLEWSEPTPATRNLGASHCWHLSCSSYRGEMVVDGYIVNAGPCAKCWSQFYQRSCQSSPNQLPTQFGLRENEWLLTINDGDI